MARKALTTKKAPGKTPATSMKSEPKATKQNAAESGEHMVLDDWSSVQVKQVAKVRRPHINQFEAVVEREDRPRGFFVVFGYSADAKERQPPSFYKRTGRVIKLISVQKILDEEHMGKM